MGASATSGIMIGVCMFGEWGPCSVQRVGLEFEFTFGFAVNVGCVCVCVWSISGPHAFGFGLRFSGIGLLVGVGAAIQNWNRHVLQVLGSIWNSIRIRMQSRLGIEAVPQICNYILLPGPSLGAHCFWAWGSGFGFRAPLFGHLPSGLIAPHS